MKFALALIVLEIVGVNLRTSSLRSRNLVKKLRAPDDDQYDFAEDESDDPSDFSVDQFLDSDNDNDEGGAFIQKAARKEEENEYNFSSVKGKNDSGKKRAPLQAHRSFVQVTMKLTPKEEEANDHYFASVEGEDDSGEMYDDEDDNEQ
eukprot:GEMP01079326.1.p1 GENE.GEMP01079326.1~~GEMP01079326.1.p1  ORF type:complete len:148 (+),score=43.14 GEMP01079326.1:75-518(+)